MKHTLNFYISLFFFLEPSTPSPIEPNDVTHGEDASKVTKPHIILVAGVTGIATVLLVVSLLLCIVVKRRKKANLEGKFKIEKNKCVKIKCSFFPFSYD